MTTEASLIIKVDSSQAKQAEKSLDSLAKSAASADKSTEGLTKSTNAFATAGKAAVSMLGTLGAALSVREVVQLADAWRSAENQLRLVTSSAGQLAETEQTLLGVANNTRSSYEATANLYARLTRATQEMGLSQQDLIGITTTINQSFAVSGATAAEAAAAITQLSQGLAAGALRGDEFNSVAEQAPGIMRAIADSLNMTVGELRAFAAEGGITAEIVVKALQQASGTIAGDFSKANLTFGQSMTVAKNNMLEFVGGSDAVQDSLSGVGSLVVGVSNSLDKMAVAAGIAAVAMTAQLAPGMVAAAAGMTSAAGAAAALRTALMLLSGPGAIVGVAAAGMYALVEAQKEAADAAWAHAMATDEVRNKLGALNQQELAAEIVKLQASTNELRRKRDGYAEISDGSAFYTEAIRKLTLEIDQNQNTTDAWIRQLRRVQDGTFAVTQATDDASKAVETFARETRLASEGTVFLSSAAWKAAAAIDGATTATESYTRATRLGRHEVVGLDTDAWKAAASIEQIAIANADAAQVSADEWRDFRNSASDVFADLIMDGENAGDALVAMFKRTFAKIMADFLVSGIAGMFTGKGMGGFSIAGALGGAGASGQILGSILGGGGAAGAAGAAGGAAGAGGIAASVGGALKSVAAGASNLIGAIPGWGWALAAAGAAVAALDKSTPSHNAGMLIHDVPGAKADQKFAVEPFASGFAPVGFARRENQDAANAVIDVFRQDDAVLTALAGKAGLSVNFNASTFRAAGLDESGRGDGVFLGSARESGGGSGASIESQRAAYVEQFVNGLGSQIGPGAKALILSAGSADAMINKAAELVAGIDGQHATGLDFVPFDGYRAVLHRGERVQTASEARGDDSAMRRMATAIESLRSDLATTAAATRRTADLLLRVTRDGESLLTTAA